MLDLELLLKVSFFFKSYNLAALNLSNFMFFGSWAANVTGLSTFIYINTHMDQKVIFFKVSKQPCYFFYYNFQLIVYF